MKMQEMIDQAKKRGIVINEDMFNDYMALLLEWNEKINLTSITEPEEIIEKHFYDCLLPVFSNLIEGKVIDVGSGAGFPGLVFAIAKPEAHITLLEPRNKRCTFLNEVIQKLGLTNVEVINERAEDYGKIHREIFDVATARAVAPLNILAELCIPFVKQGGNFIAMKGTQWKEEYEEAKKAFKELGCGEGNIIEEELPSGAARCLLSFSKVCPTPNKYPRAYGQIKKKPL